MIDEIQKSIIEYSDEEELIKDKLIDLYLKVKIRDNDSVGNYSEDQLRMEKLNIKQSGVNELTLIDYIQLSVEFILRMDDFQKTQNKVIILGHLTHEKSPPIKVPRIKMKKVHENLQSLDTVNHR